MNAHNMFVDVSVRAVINCPLPLRMVCVPFSYNHPPYRQRQRTPSATPPICHMSYIIGPMQNIAHLNTNVMYTVDRNGYEDTRGNEGEMAGRGGAEQLLKA